MDIWGLALLGILIVISPGADFVLVLQTSLNAGRKAGVWTALGISVAITLHISYSMLGLSYFISQNPTLFAALRYLGAGYLIYLGVKGLLSKSQALHIERRKTEEQSGFYYFRQGLLCNALNPKTMLFFLSVFSQVMMIDTTSQTIPMFYGLYMIALHGLWFSAVAMLLTSDACQSLLLSAKDHINKLCSAGLIAFGASLGLLG